LLIIFVDGSGIIDEILGFSRLDVLSEAWEAALKLFRDN
tara:strand:- start:786 stop:902 length:117 start_codon:yes stop_codon:yes gene_type:complete